MADTAVSDLESRAKSFYAIAEPLAKTCVAAAALCYGVGVLVKNLYLAQWATFSASLLQAEYVLAGALFMFIVLLGVTFWSCTFGIRQRAKLERNQQAATNYSRLTRKLRLKTVRVAILGSLGVAIFLGFVYDLDLSDIRGSKRLGDYGIALAIVFLLFPSLLFYAWRPVGDVWKNRALGRATPPGETAMKLFFRSTLLLAVLVVYVRAMYPRIPPVYGGGKRVSVQVRLTEDGIRLLRSSGISTVSKDPRLLDAELIFESDSFLMVLLRTNTDMRPLAMRIRHDQVISIATRSTTSHDWM
jgi:hypothetical protein